MKPQACGGEARSFHVESNRRCNLFAFGENDVARAGRALTGFNGKRLMYRDSEMKSALHGRKQRRQMKVGKKNLSFTKRKLVHGPESFSFSIDVYSPETIPMVRLGEYMTELAKMLGEQESVHFERVVTGSTKLQHAIEFEAIPKVREKLLLLKRGLAGIEPAKHFNNINKMLKADNAVGSYSEAGKTAAILSFPGRTQVVQETIVSKQRGSIQGTVTRVGGADETAHVQIVSGKQKIGGCVTTRAIARELGKLLYQDVRLHGAGKWLRDQDGQWAIEEFKIEAFDHLQSDGIDAAILELRAVGTVWHDDPVDRLKSLRGE